MQGDWLYDLVFVIFVVEGARGGIIDAVHADLMPKTHIFQYLFSAAMLVN